MSLLPRRSEIPLMLTAPAEFVRRYSVPLAILAAGALADAVTTFHAMSRFGPAAEVHPVQRLMFEILGVAAGVPLAKLAQVVFVVLVAAWWRPWCPWLIGGCGVLYGVAAISNHFVWF